MKISQLELNNFKKYQSAAFDFHPQFTLLIGENGSGKTTLLDALAVAIGIWGKKVPGSSRNIQNEEVRLEPIKKGDRVFFNPKLPTSISATGTIGRAENITWTRKIKKDGNRTSNASASGAEKAIEALLIESENDKSTLPILAYYGAGRAWLPSNAKRTSSILQFKPKRFDAYRKCLDTRIHEEVLNEWFLIETAATTAKGKKRPGFEVVKKAIMDCIPGADGLHYDVDLKEIVLSIRGESQPFNNLSAGQKMMLALIADIAIKAVSLNSYLLGSSGNETFLSAVPGIVLIDELDVHLHPSWQRQIASDLKNTFPSVQFICTSHSPQIIGELLPEEIRLLVANSSTTPAHSIGIDSNRVLEEIMDTKPRSVEYFKKMNLLFSLIDKGNFKKSQKIISELVQKMGEDDPEVIRANSLVKFLKDK